MEIQIDSDTKVRIAKYGPNRLFGDYKERQILEAETLTQRFDETWRKQLGAAINQATPSQANKKSLKMQLTPAESQYFDDSQEHYQFTLGSEGLRFFAQLRVEKDKNQTMLTQLWETSTRHSRLKPDELLERLTKKQREAQIWSDIYYRSGF